MIEPEIVVQRVMIGAFVAGSIGLIGSVSMLLYQSDKIHARAFLASIGKGLVRLATAGVLVYLVGLGLEGLVDDWILGSCANCTAGGVP